MNILYELDDNFAPQVSASMASVCENNREMPNLKFYVFGLGLSGETKQNLLSLAQRYNREAVIIPIDGFMKAFGDFDTLGWTEVVMGRLLIARFLPEDVQSVLYLDGDTIVRRSIHDLDELDLDEGKVLGAVIEATVDRSRLRPLGIEGEPYINSGVLLIDLRRWRAANVEDKLLQYCKEHRDHIVAPDQDAINGALKGNIQMLPPGYNWCNSYVFYPYRVLKRLMGNIPFYTREEFESSIQDPTIVHFLGEERPWRKGNTHAYKNEYRNYLSLTPYAKQPEEEGWELYFRAWRVFNLFMRPFPMIRYRVITALIPKMMSWRKNRRVKQA